MARERIHSVSFRHRMVYVYWDSFWQEYIARLYLSGTLYEPADYFTDSRSDAIETANLMAQPLSKEG